MIIWWSVLIIFIMVMLVERYFYNKRILKYASAEVKKLETYFQNMLIEKQKTYNDLADQKWDIMLLNAAKDDGESLVKNLYVEEKYLTTNSLNREFQKAKTDFNQAFKDRLPLRPTVARIINLLQLEAYNQEYITKQKQKHLN